MRGPVQSVEVSYLVHATEDYSKINGAVQRALRISSPPETEELEGHFGNGIIRVKHHLTGDAAWSTLSSLAESLSSGARMELLGSLGQMMDEHGALYLRLGKQSFLAGPLELAENNAVRVRVKPRLFQAKGGAEGFFREALGAIK